MTEPYNVAAYALEISFSEKFPFEAPALTFKTPIFHPNFDEKGAVCLNTCNPAHWKPATKMAQVLEDLVKLIHEPEPDHPLREDVAALFLTDRKKFTKEAADHAAKHGLKRP